MFDSEEKSRQVEFFSDSSTKSHKQKKEKFRLGKVALSLSYENILIFTIALIMLFVACYSLGVEKGRRLVQGVQEPAKAQTIVDTAEVKEKEQAKEEPIKSIPEKRIRIKVAAVEPPHKSRTYIQVASFLTSKNAQREMNRLKDKGYTPFTANWGKYKVVCVGGYQNHDQASRDLKQLRKLYADCILRNR